MTRFIFALLFCFTQLSLADISVVDIRRNIPLSDDEPAYTDFYINGGESDGFKKNLVVTAFRNINIRDFSGAQSYGEIQVPVGQLRILAVYGKVSVAREYKLLPRDENPMLEQVGIMSGDRISMKGSFVDSKRKPQAIAKPAVAPPPATPVLVMTPPPTGNTPARLPPQENSIPEVLLESPVNNTPAPTAVAPTATALQ